MVSAEKPFVQLGKGYNTFKVIAALRMASQKNGVTMREMGLKMGLKPAVCKHVFDALVIAGEVIKENDRYYCDVYKDIPDHNLVRPGATEDAKKSYSSEVTEFKAQVIAAMGEVAHNFKTDYPPEIFGSSGVFVQQIINRFFRSVMSAMKEMKSD